jgi:hypothetical protein
MNRDCRVIYCGCLEHDMTVWSGRWVSAIERNVLPSSSGQMRVSMEKWQIMQKWKGEEMGHTIWEGHSSNNGYYVLPCISFSCCALVKGLLLALA